MRNDETKKVNFCSKLYQEQNFPWKKIGATSICALPDPTVPREDVKHNFAAQLSTNRLQFITTIMGLKFAVGKGGVQRVYLYMLRTGSNIKQDLHSEDKTSIICRAYFGTEILNGSKGVGFLLWNRETEWAENVENATQ